MRDVLDNFFFWCMENVQIFKMLVKKSVEKKAIVKCL